MIPTDAAAREQEVARDLAEAFEIALAPGWNRLYPDDPRTPNLWDDIHPDAQACWLAVAKRALHLATHEVERARAADALSISLCSACIPKGDRISLCPHHTAALRTPPRAPAAP